MHKRSQRFGPVLVPQHNFRGMTKDMYKLLDSRMRKSYRETEEERKNAIRDYLFYGTKYEI